MAAMRIVAWNIRAGGGRRVDTIAEQLAAWDADIAVLTEFRDTPPSRALAASLAELGLPHQRSTATTTAPGANEVLVASRWPFRRTRRPCEPPSASRWLHATIDSPSPLALVGLHIPIGRPRQQPYYNAVLETMRRWRRRPAIITGDTNSGRPGADEESPTFGPRHTAWFDAIEALGWRDTFRHLHPGGRDYTWYSPNASNGFRLDQAFVSPALLPAVRAMRHEWARDPAADGRRDAVSDHAALLLDLDIPGNDGSTHEFAAR